MTSHWVRRAMTILFCLAVGSLAFAAAEEQAGETTTLTGDVEAAAYDEDGNITAVSIYDREWGSVLVSSHGQGAKLLDLVGAVVKVTGTLVETDDESDFAYVIHVTAFTVEQAAEPEEDLGWDPEEEPGD